MLLALYAIQHDELNNQSIICTRMCVVIYIITTTPAHFDTILVSVVPGDDTKNMSRLVILVVAM
jgi:hypothetical protein